MPIYFNLESHFWVIELFLVNGLLVTWLLRNKYLSFRTLTSSLESQLVSAFFISLAINSVVLLSLDVLKIPFVRAGVFLFLFSVIVFVLLVLTLRATSSLNAIKSEFSAFRLLIYATVFVILFYNGGYIEQVSDAWWHMSLANKIGLEGSFSSSSGHLIGLTSRYYPPLWHGNIAMVNQVSDVPIHVIWNTLTPWVGVLKLMAFYLFVFGLTKSRAIAVLSVLLFFLLPGVGVSYMRVSAWPSHVAYTAWFVMFYLATLLLDALSRETRWSVSYLSDQLASQMATIICLLVLGVIAFFTHKAEILWFSVAWFAYLAGASIRNSLSDRKHHSLDIRNNVIALMYRGVLVLLAIYSAYFASVNINFDLGVDDQFVSNILPLICIILLIFIEVASRSSLTSKIAVISLVGIVFASIDYIHLASLFMPELALPQGSNYASSSIATGYLGGDMQLPGLHQQLRSGLLYAGILSVPISIALMVFTPSRSATFLASTSVIAFIFCFSPYFYDWLQRILNYHSPWRVSLLIFHPVTWAIVCVSLSKYAFNGYREKTNDD